MAKNKTTVTERSVESFVADLDNEQRKEDSYVLIEFLERVSGHKAKMWGPSIIGFGSYHYRYESGHEGEAPRLGFSPRKAAISLYVYTGLPLHEPLLEGLGHQKVGKACIYVKKSSDLNFAKLEVLCKTTLDYLQELYDV
jgi:hypothetical protein